MNNNFPLVEKVDVQIQACTNGFSWFAQAFPGQQEVYITDILIKLAEHERIDWMVWAIFEYDKKYGSHCAKLRECIPIGEAHCIGCAFNEYVQEHQLTTQGILDYIGELVRNGALPPPTLVI